LAHTSKALLTWKCLAQLSGWGGNCPYCPPWLRACAEGYSWQWCTI